MNTQFLFKEVFMKKEILKQRASAVQKYLAGEDPASICASVGKTTRWLYKWVARHTPNDPTWFEDRSRRPLTSPFRTPAEIGKDRGDGSIEPVQQGALLRQSGHPMGDDRYGGATGSLPQHHRPYFAPPRIDPSADRKIYPKGQKISRASGAFAQPNPSG